MAKWHKLVFPMISLLVVAADQLSKVWVTATLALGESIPPRGIFQLTHVRNTGIAFGLFQNQSVPLILVVSVSIALLLFIVLSFMPRFPLLNSGPGKLAFSLVIGGTIGNLTDRLRLGYVTDFIDVGFWPAFNIADSAITVGVILLVSSFFFLAKATDKTG